MCAIAGIFGGRPTEGAVLEKMLSTMERRGPDQRGLWQEENRALLHARLAVIDPAGGRQPMEYGPYVMVYNGELYNTGELREELEALGHRFRGRSDTEVLLHGYAQWKEGVLPQLNGIFAFGVYEKDTGRLFLARDRIGVKPLFYALRGDTLIFASEIKTILAHPAVEPELDAQGVGEIMLLGPGRTPGCGVFRGIREIEPAQYAFFEEGRLETAVYWSLTDREHRDSLGETLEKVRFLVTDAIKRQLVSDVPICTFLSGGLDSSLISSVAARALGEKGQQLTTFSLDYRDNEKYFTAGKFQPTSDPAYIRMMADYLGSDHHWVILENRELADALYEAVRARDLPGMADVDSSLLLLCRAMKPQATVALSGECADEIFGGYPWYRDPEVRARAGFPWAQSTAWRAGFLAPEYRFSLDAEEFVRSRYEKTCREASSIGGLPAQEVRLREMVNLNFRWFMQTLLDRKDRMSMYSGLEVRVPFCDWRIAEYLYSVPWEMKDLGGREKGLLRQAMEGYLPDAVLHRKKSPFPKTHNPGYLTEVSRRLRAILAEGTSPLLDIADREALEGLFSAQYPWPWYGQLMQTPQTIAYMLQIDCWMREYKVKLV